MSALMVHLNGRRVGVLREEDHQSTFRYDEAWLEDELACALSRQLPLQSDAFVGRPVEVFFGGLLPEADSRDQIARNLGISSDNDFAMLERIGGECAGAISLLTKDMPSQPAGDLRWLNDGQLAEIVERLPQRPLLAGDQGLRLSLAGAQVKLPVVIEERPGETMRVALPRGDTPSTHIIKPEPSRFPGLAANEAWCMTLALRIGLDAAEAWEERIGNVPCLIAKRYDRVPGPPDGSAKRLHQEDFCQAMGFPSSRKYQQESGPSLRDCFRLIREWSTTPVLDIKHMLDAVIFAVVTGNADAHGKNYSFLYTGDRRRMAPLYDQVCTMAWPELSTMLSMKVGSASTLAEVSPEHFRQFCAQTKLGWPMARDRLKTICRDILETLANSEVGIEVEAPKVREIVGQRAERMLRLMNQANG